MPTARGRHPAAMPFLGASSSSSCGRRTTNDQRKGNGYSWCFLLFIDHWSLVVRRSSSLLRKVQPAPPAFLALDEAVGAGSELVQRLLRRDLEAHGALHRGVEHLG